MNWIQKIATWVFLIVLTWSSIFGFLSSLFDFLDTLPLFLEVIGWLIFMYLGIDGLEMVSSEKTIEWPESENNE